MGSGENGWAGGGPIRILTLIEATSIDGIVKPLFEFLREARRPGAAPSIDVSLAAFVRGEPDNLLVQAARREQLPLDLILEARRFDLSVLARLREVIARRRPDLIWTHNAKSHFLTRFAGLHHRATWVASHHGYTTTTWLMRLYNQLNRWSLRAAPCVLTVCHPFADQLVATGVRRDRITVLHSPLRSMPPDPSLGRELRRELGLGDGIRIVLSVGRLSREKGHAELFRALAAARTDIRCPPLRLLLVGDGQEMAPLRALARQLGLNGIVVFCGHRADVRPYYSAADLFVLASHSEGSPNVLLEAMDAGVPILATRVGGVPEMLTDERTAILVERGDVAEMSARMLGALIDGELRARLALSGRQAVSGYAPEQYFKRLADIFARLAAR